jgi:hypothetical protein
MGQCLEVEVPVRLTMQKGILKEIRATPTDITITAELDGVNRSLTIHPEPGREFQLRKLLSDMVPSA